MKRSVSEVPQRTGGRVYGSRQNHDTSERTSNCCAALMRACGGISNERSSSKPRRPVALSGLYILSMHISVRWVFPVTSTSRLRNDRSTSHGRTSCPLAPTSCNLRNAISNSYSESCRASSTRGDWLVGPMNKPENRYDSEGWFIQ